MRQFEDEICSLIEVNPDGFIGCIEGLIKFPSRLEIGRNMIFKTQQTKSWYTFRDVQMDNSKSSEKVSFETLSRSLSVESFYFVIKS